MADITFEDYSAKVKDAIKEAGIAFLHEVGVEFVAQTARNSRVKTEQTKGSWDYQVNESDLEVQIGSPLENAIWEEFGTGEYALNDDGRKGGWFYYDELGNGHFTHGKKPNRALWNAFESLKSKIQIAMENQLKGID